MASYTAITGYRRLRLTLELGELLDLFSRLRAMTSGVGSFREVVVEPRQDLVLTREDVAGVGDETRDLDLAGPLVLLGGDLARREIDAQLRQPLPHLVGVRAPLRLEQLEHG